jgi:hypothetical protein
VKRRDGGADPAQRTKTFFLSRSARGDFIRSTQHGPTKTILFLFVALTLQGVMAKSIIRSSDRVAEFDGAACAAKKR